MLGRKKASSDERRNARPNDVSSSDLTDERRVGAWVGRSMVIRGDVKSSEDLTIDGDVEGDVAVREHNLVIGQNATIRANIVARTVTVHGTVTGTITASEKVSIGRTGTVQGDIHSPKLAVDEGGMLQGKIGVGTDPGSGAAPPRAPARSR